MSDFRIRVQAELDATKLTGQLNELKNKTVPIKVKLEGLDDSSALKFLEKLTKKDRNINVNVNVAGDSKIKSVAQDLEKIKTLSSGSSKIKIDIGGSGSGSGSVKDTISDYKILKNLVDEINKKKVKLAGLDTEKDTNQIKTLEANIKSLEAEYKNLFSSMKGNLSDNQIVSLGRDLEKVQNQVAETTAKMQDMSKVAKETSQSFSRLDAATSANKSQAIVKANTKLTKEYTDALNQNIEAQRTASNSKELSSARKEFQEIMARARLEGKTGKSVKDSFMKSFGQIFEFAGMYGAIQNVVFEAPRQMIQAVQEVNASQIELAKVSEASGTQLTNYWDQAADSAKKYGATISDVISSTADWSKLGYDLDESKVLSDVTTLYQKVGDNMTQETASQSLVSTLQGFNMQASEAESIVDKFNEVNIAASVCSNTYALCA